MQAPAHEVLPDAAALARRAADILVERIETALRERYSFSLALAGGRTPQSLYRLLAEAPYKDRIPWDRLRVYWGDERFVPSGHEDSNYRMAREAFLDRVPLPKCNVYPIRGDLDSAARAAEVYEEILRGHFKIGGPPRLDFIFLGLGEDGHTASLFPGSPALAEKERWLAAVEAPKTPPERVTMTFPILNAARELVFLACGEEKRRAVRAIFSGEGADLPAALARPEAGRLLWLLDREAAAGL